MKLRAAMDSGQFKRAGGAEAASVRIVLEDGSEYPRPGRLLFSDLTVDATTGQITLRAEVPNPGGQLLPGLYVRVRLEQAQVSNAITLPQQAVTRTAQGDSVMRKFPSRFPLLLTVGAAALLAGCSMGPLAISSITSAIVTESVFSLPGIGKLIVNGAANRDYTLVLGLVVLVTVIAVTLNLLVDLAYALLDPKIRY